MFNNCTLCPHYIYVFCIYLRTNSDSCHLYQRLIGFYNRDEKCLQRGMNWVFKQSSLRFAFEELTTIPIQIYKGVHVYSHTFLTLALGWSVWSASNPTHFIHEESNSAATKQETDWAPVLARMLQSRENCFPLLGIKYQFLGCPALLIKLWMTTMMTVMITTLCNMFTIAINIKLNVSSKQLHHSPPAQNSSTLTYKLS